MAKIKKNVKSQVNCPSTCMDYKPRLYLDLQDSDVAQIKGLAVGEKVELLVSGTVKGLEQRERSEESSKKMVKTGSIQLESYSVTVVEDEQNEFTKMADADED